MGAFQRQLETVRIGRGLLVFPVTDSTMIDAKNLAEKNAQEGTIICAEFQTAGVGRVEGRQWSSSERKNLLFTIIMRFDNFRRLPMACATAMVKACRMEGTNAWIKWSNDVWVGDCKIAGVMISPGPGALCQLIGIGINVNEIFDPVPIPLAGNAQGPTVKKGSLAGFLGKSISRERVLANFCNEFERLLDIPHEKLLEQFSSHQGLLGRQVKIFPNKAEEEQSYEATVSGFVGDGNMVVQAPQGTVTLSAQEVTIRPVDVADLIVKPLLLQTLPHELLTGMWENQLGSRMSLTATQDGILEGRYHTAVGMAVDDPSLRGTWTCADDGGAVLGFSVAWRVSPGAKKSATSWAGRLYFDRETGDVSLVTMWHLVAAMKKSASWSSYHTNQDTFHKLV